MTFNIVIVDAFVSVSILKLVRYRNLANMAHNLTNISVDRAVLNRMRGVLQCNEREIDDSRLLMMSIDTIIQQGMLNLH